jgi:FkbM family methyltransferase
VKFIKINFPNKTINFKFREDSRGDLGVLNQIFRNEDYDLSRFSNHNKSLFKYIDHHTHLNRDMLIIDAGANIGASSVYFNHYFPRGRIFAIEPDVGNFELLVENTKECDGQDNFFGAIASHDGTLFLSDPGFSDWGFRTHKDLQLNSVSVNCISPNKILSLKSNLQPLLFKIDIEGAESDLFSSDHSWMDLFPLIIIELHDWMLPFQSTSRNFFKAMVDYDFEYLNHGENIFLFNKRLLNQFNRD